MRELFNYRHSFLLSVVERAFGVLKKRVPILKSILSYPLQYQQLFVVACCTINNFIRKSCGVTGPLFEVALRRLNFWVDVVEWEEGLMVSYVSPGK